jgi:hypothetical protein
MLIGLLIRRGSILEAKLRIAKRLNKAHAVTRILLAYKGVILSG